MVSDDRTSMTLGEYLSEVLVGCGDEPDNAWAPLLSLGAVREYKAEYDALLARAEAAERRLASLDALAELGAIYADCRRPNGHLWMADTDSARDHYEADTASDLADVLLAEEVSDGA